MSKKGFASSMQVGAERLAYVADENYRGEIIIESQLVKRTTHLVMVVDQNAFFRSQRCGRQFTIDSADQILSPSPVEALERLVGWIQNSTKAAEAEIASNMNKLADVERLLELERTAKS